MLNETIKQLEEKQLLGAKFNYIVCCKPINVCCEPIKIESFEEHGAGAKRFGVIGYSNGAAIKNSGKYKLIFNNIMIVNEYGIAFYGIDKVARLTGVSETVKKSKIKSARFKGKKVLIFLDDESEISYTIPYRKKGWASQKENRNLINTYFINESYKINPNVAVSRI